MWKWIWLHARNVTQSTKRSGLNGMHTAQPRIGRVHLGKAHQFNTERKVNIVTVYKVWPLSAIRADCTLHNIMWLVIACTTADLHKIHISNLERTPYWLIAMRMFEFESKHINHVRRFFMCLHLKIHNFDNDCNQTYATACNRHFLYSFLFVRLFILFLPLLC